MEVPIQDGNYSGIENSYEASRERAFAEKLEADKQLEQDEADAMTASAVMKARVEDQKKQDEIIDIVQGVIDSTDEEGAKLIEKLKVLSERLSDEDLDTLYSILDAFGLEKDMKDMSAITDEINAAGNDTALRAAATKEAEGLEGDDADDEDVA